MGLSKSDMQKIVRRQLAIDMNCDERDFCTDGVTFCEAKINQGRRMFERQNPYLEIATMGRGIVVSADADIMTNVKSMLEGKTRDDIFFAPFVYGHSLYYIPDTKTMKQLPCPDDFTYHISEGEEIYKLYEHPGFSNAIQYDIHHPRPDGLAVYLEKNNEIVAMAGASIDCPTMWQIGIDVLPAYRNIGLATFLVSNLAVMIMERGIVPYYGTASSNIPSQSVAYRSGMMPAWMCTYKNILDGKSPFQVSNLNIEK